jgi:hypothetical protein
MVELLFRDFDPGLVLARIVCFGQDQERDIQDFEQCCLDGIAGGGTGVDDHARDGIPGLAEQALQDAAAFLIVYRKMILDL